MSSVETLLPRLLQSRVLLPKGPRVGRVHRSLGCLGMIPSARKPNEPVEVVSMRARSRSGGCGVGDDRTDDPPCWLRRIRWDVIVGGSRTGCAFGGSLVRLVTGASWVSVEAILERRVSDTTLRSRRDEWITAGCSTIAGSRLGCVDRIIGLDLSGGGDRRVVA